MSAHTLVPDPSALRLDYIVPGTQAIILVLTTLGSAVACPVCGHPSTRVHSRYRRSLADLPWNGVSLPYDSSGRLTVQKPRSAVGAPAWSVTYSAALGTNGYTQVTDPRGNVSRWDYTWNPSQYGYQITSTRDPLGRTTTFERTAAPTHLVTGIVDFRGRRVTQGWDTARGNLTSVTLPTASGGTVTWTATYEPNFSRRTSVTDPLNRTSTWNVDPATGNVTRFTDARGAVTSFTYAANGDRLSLTNALNQTTTSSYDPTTGDLCSATDPAGHTTTRSYNIKSQPYEVTDANGRKVRYAFNALDWLTSETRFMGLFNETLLTTQYYYDNEGNRSSLTTPVGASWSWYHNVYDQVIEEWNPSNQKISYAYDANNNLVRRTDRLGQWIDYSYGSGDRLTSMTCWKAGGIRESTVTLTYDATTHLLTSVTDNAFGSQTWSWSYDSLDRITSETGPHGTVSYTLDNLGRRTALAATGQAPISYTYGPTDLVTSLSQNGLSATFEYDLLSRITRRCLPNGVSTEWAYTSAGFLSSLVSKRNGTTFDSRLYTHDPVGTLTRINRNGSLDTFEYDELYRLKSASLPGIGSWSFRYDFSGNRVESVHNGQTTHYTCDSANCLTAINGVAVEHDANGQLTRFGSETYSWDVRGRLIRLEKGGATYEFAYDPFGLRTGKKAGGVWTYFLLDGASVVKEISGGSGVYTTQGPLLDEPLARNSHAFTVNHEGSIPLTDSAGERRSDWPLLQSGALLPPGVGAVPLSGPDRVRRRVKPLRLHREQPVRCDGSRRPQPHQPPNPTTGRTRRAIPFTHRNCGLGRNQERRCATASGRWASCATIRPLRRDDYA